MNGKKAKLLRSVGKVKKHDKRLYHQLSKEDRHTLSKMYKTLTKKSVD